MAVAAGLCWRGEFAEALDNDHNPEHKRGDSEGQVNKEADPDGAAPFIFKIEKGRGCGSLLPGREELHVDLERADSD